MRRARRALRRTGPAAPRNRTGADRRCRQTSISARQPAPGGDGGPGPRLLRANRLQHHRRDADPIRSRNAHAPRPSPRNFAAELPSRPRHNLICSHRSAFTLSSRLFRPRPAISECRCATLAGAGLVSVPARERNQGTGRSCRGDGRHGRPAGLAAGDKRDARERPVETCVRCGAGVPGKDAGSPATGSRTQRPAPYEYGATKQRVLECRNGNGPLRSAVS
jgi:hypothetical protein